MNKADSAPVAVVPETEVDEDPFSGITDEPAAEAPEVIRHYLDRARRNYAELNRDWIQKSRKTDGSRQSFLADFVRQRRETALEALLLLHSLEPVLRNGDPLAMGVWAAMLSEATGHVVSANGASKAFGTLEEMRLVRRIRKGHQTVIKPLAEDGSGADWERTGTRRDAGQGYFTLPFAYWTSGFAGRLSLPGKAMLLILLADTNYKSSAQIPIEKVPGWYGVSERTAERGYRQLTQAGLLMTKAQRVASPSVPGGYRIVRHRALRTPFSQLARQNLQRAAQEAGTRRRRTVDTPGRAATTLVANSMTGGGD